MSKEKFTTRTVGTQTFIHFERKAGDDKYTGWPATSPRFVERLIRPARQDDVPGKAEGDAGSEPKSP